VTSHSAAGWRTGPVSQAGEKPLDDD
jgi:hypothetical protein